MIEQLNRLLMEVVGKDVRIIERKNFSYDKKFFPISSEYIFIYSQEKDTKFLYKLKILLAEIIKEYKEIEEKAKKYELLQKELDAILHSYELYFGSHGNLKDFFSFLDQYAIQYVLIENGEKIIDTGIPPFTIQTTIQKLKKLDSLDLPIKNGELFAIKKGYYIIIVQSEKKIDSLIKKVLYMRLLWLNALYEEKMFFQVDNLTGAYTRNKFIEDMKNFQNRPVIIINVVDFHTINQIYSPAIGDKILIEIVQRLKKFSQNVYRLYGDRFALVQEERYAIDTIIKRLKKEIFIYNPLTKEYNRFHLQYNFLIFEKLEEHILEYAISVFKKYKKEVIHFHKDIKPIIEEENKNYKILTRALEKDHITPFFQKVVNIKDFKVAYYEALMRIVDEEEILPPISFITLAKEKGLYKKLNYIMIQKSIQAIKKLHTKVSINIDIYDILQTDIIDYIKKIFEEENVDPTMVQFEILEEEDIYKHMEKVKDFIQKVKDLGCSVALDDFGKGYSNFAAIQELKVDNLKIDISLIKPIAIDNSSYKILQAIATVSKELRIKATAEGVSSKNIYHKLQKCNIDYLQGFYIGVPKSIDEILNI